MKNTINLNADCFWKANTFSKSKYIFENIFKGHLLMLWMGQCFQIRIILHSGLENHEMIKLWNVILPGACYATADLEINLLKKKSVDKLMSY